jgi:WD40 repeat protein
LSIAACNNYSGGENNDSTGISDEFRDYTGVEIKEPLYPPTGVQPNNQAAPRAAADPIVIADCRLNVFNKEDVPALRDGAIMVIGTDEKGAKATGLPEDRKYTVVIGKKPETYYYLKEGDLIKEGQLMAVLDDRVARDDKDIKEAKINVAQADWKAAMGVRDEYKARWDTQVRLLGGKPGLAATSREDERLAKVQYEKAMYEAETKKDAITQAQLERDSAKTVVELHEVRSSLNGVLKMKHKSRGDAIKALEPLYQVHDLENLRVEGMADLQHAYKLKPGMKVVVEPSLPIDPEKTFGGHIQEITSVAFGTYRDKPFVVSTSEDGTLRFWRLDSTREERILPMPRTTARAVACSPKGAASNFLLCGTSDGTARLWNLATVDSNTKEPTYILKDQHKAPITCVAFSPDGKYIALGSEDRKISIWETETGAFKFALPCAHRGPITSVQFTPQCRLVSAGRDNTLRIWELGKSNARLEKDFDRRSGDVMQTGTSPDGTRLLLDQGKSLRILSVPEGLTEGVLENHTGTSNFNTFALFSPGGNLIVTSSGSEGRMQLWRAPTAKNPRPSEIRQLIPSDRSATVTCAAFSQDGQYLVTGGRDRKVLVWKMPTDQEINAEITAQLTLIDQAVESGGAQIKVWAELQNKDLRLHPGDPVTMVVYPKGE